MFGEDPLWMSIHCVWGRVYNFQSFLMLNKKTLEDPFNKGVSFMIVIKLWKV